MTPANNSYVCEQKLREDVLLMKQYLCSCRAATEAKLLLRLSSRQHFVDNSDVYSLQDLYDVQAGTLLPQLQEVYAIFEQHIKHDCLVRV